MEKKLYLVRNTVITALLYFFVCFIAGAIIIVGGLEGTTAVLTQAVCLVISSVLAILFYTVRKRNLSEIGLASFQRGALKDVYFAVPLVAISISALFVGVNTDAFKASFANLLLAVAVGFSEEIYFRGIIYHIWEKRSRKSAVVISALIFGVFHLMNVLVGADVGYTVLQVIFAFFYGITLAIIVSIMESIWPCILLHFFHDLCAFMGNDASRMVEMIYVAVWILILVIYIVCMLKRQKKNGN